jgi:hypothetical protein
MSSPSKKKNQKQEKNKVAIRWFPIFKCFLKGKTNVGYVGHHHQAAPRAAAANVSTSGLVPRHNGSTHDLVGGFTDSWDQRAVFDVRLLFGYIKCLAYQRDCKNRTTQNGTGRASVWVNLLVKPGDDMG